MMGKDDNGKISCTGRVRLQIDIVPIELAVKNPVGKARNEPNHSPFLPKPEGRIEFTTNPLKMFEQMVGPAFRRKLYVALCCLACIIITLPMLPSMIGTWIVNGIS